MAEEIKNLEDRVDSPDSFSNEVEVSSKDGDFVYVGRAYDLRFEGNDIRGGAEIAKYQKKVIKKQAKKLVWAFPPRLENKEVIKEKRKKIWEWSSVFSSNYFVCNGRLCNGYDCSADYRGYLKSQAMNHGVKISGDIFEKVFGPIDQKIMEKLRGYY